MIFVSVDSTEDGRITKGRSYHGNLVLNIHNSLRVAVFDNTLEWMTFDPAIFIPLNQVGKTHDENA